MGTTVIDQKVYGALEESVGADFIGVMLDAFLEETAQLLATLKQSFSAGDVDAFRRAAHSMKSNAATFGATQLSEQARELEYIAREGNLSEVGNKLEFLEAALQVVTTELKGLMK